jgi:taurine dioxygenase
MVIRGQQAMTPDDHLAFAGRFGPISIHPYVPSIEGYPGVMKVYAVVPVTQTWHADSTHRKDPPAITFLLPRILPEIGGDTMFASATRAFEQLSDGLRETLLGLRAVHVGTEGLASDAGLTREQVTATHPVIRTHGETGKRALFVNADYTTHFEGWTEKESRSLLEYLYAWVGRVENVYRHRWQAGDLVIWDNHATQHAVVGDTYGAERMLDRVTVSRSAS